MTPSEQNPGERHVERHAVGMLLAARPAWLDEGKERFGAPDFLWQMTIRRFGLQHADWLLTKPQTLRLALVVSWNHWRRRWIESEWRTT